MFRKAYTLALEAEILPPFLPDRAEPEKKGFSITQIETRPKIGSTTYHRILFSDVRVYYF